LTSGPEFGRSLTVGSPWNSFTLPSLGRALVAPQPEAKRSVNFFFFFFLQKN